ncbi:uncharacterized protein LOC144211943 [Stigmatopora nigra]
MEKDEVGRDGVTLNVKALVINPRACLKGKPEGYGAVSIGENAPIALKILRMQYEARDREYAHQLALKKMEIELKRLDIELSKSFNMVESRGFKVSESLPLVPPFRETGVEAWFSAFERIALSHKWPEEGWALVLQRKLSGKGLEALSTLSIEDGLVYDKVKAAVLRVYELVPEAYRQKFRNHKLKPGQAVAEFGHEKEKALELERVEKARVAQEWLAKEKALEFARLEKARLEKARLEQERLEKERVLEFKRQEREKALELARLEKACLEKARLEQERLEKERVLEFKRQEKEKALEQDRLEREKALDYQLARECLGVLPEALDEVAGEREVRASRLKLLPL